MIRYTPEQLTYDYDAFADVLYVTFRKAVSVVCNETPLGFVLRRSRPGDDIVGVTILDYVSTYGASLQSIEVDAPTPFVVETGPIDCEMVAYG